MSKTLGQQARPWEYLQQLGQLYEKLLSCPEEYLGENGKKTPEGYVFQFSFSEPVPNQECLGEFFFNSFWNQAEQAWDQKSFSAFYPLVYYSPAASAFTPPLQKTAFEPSLLAKETLGFGTALCLRQEQNERQKDLMEQFPAWPFFCHIFFHSNQDQQDLQDEWSGLGPYELFTPQFLIERFEKSWRYSLQAIIPLAPEKRLKTAAVPRETFESRFPSPSSPIPGPQIAIHDELLSPTPCEWNQLIPLFKDFLDQRNPGDQRERKLVFSRKKTYSLAKSIHPLDFLYPAIIHRNSASAVYFIGIGPEQSFLSLTPEKLFIRQGHHLWMDSLAGTQVRELPHLPTESAQKLLRSNKDRKENLFVSDFIRERLQDFAHEIKQGPLGPLVLPQLIHLYAPIYVHLHTALTDLQLISLLHPTPALGGYPQQAALDFLALHRPFNRGLFGGVIGKITSQQSELHVGIRSGLMGTGKLHLFAGAGLLQESHWEQEWNEMEQKMQSFLKNLHVHVHWVEPG